MKKAAAFVRWNPLHGGFYRTRVRFKGSRPWIDLAPGMGEDAAKALAGVLRRCARSGYCIEYSHARRAWRPLLEVAGGERLLTVPIDIADHDEAIARASSLAKTEREKGVASIVLAKKQLEEDGAPSLTCDQYFDKLFAHREDNKGQSSVKDSRGRYNKWIKPTIGHLPMRLVGREQLEAIVRGLDVAIADETLSAKTAANAWGEVTAGFKVACKSKQQDLRVLERNPTLDVEGPDGGIDKEKPILFPDELLALLRCLKVPLYRRRAYAVAVYTGARANELAALTAGDVDLEHLQLAIAKQRDRKSKGDKQTKTRRAKAIEIERELVPLLEVLVRARPSGRLLHLPPDEDRAQLLRQDLRAAGVKREALFVDGDPGRLPLWFHHLRDTCLTWMAVRGDDIHAIKERGRHTTYNTTEKYIGAAVSLRRGFGQPFPPLPPEVLLEGVLDGSAADRRRVREASADVATVDHSVDHSPRRKKKKPPNRERSEGFYGDPNGS